MVLMLFENKWSLEQNLYHVIVSLPSGKSCTGLEIPLDHGFIEKSELMLKPPVYRSLGHFCWYNVTVCVCPVTDEYNETLVFSPDDSRLFYSIREPIVNRVFSNSRQRGFASKSVTARPAPSKLSTTRWGWPWPFFCALFPPECASALVVGMPAWSLTVGLHLSSTTVLLLQSACVRRTSFGQLF